MYLFTVSQICCFIDFFAFSIWTVRPVFEQCDQYSRKLLYKRPHQCRNNMGDAHNCEARAPLVLFNECLEMAYGYGIS